MEDALSVPFIVSCSEPIPGSRNNCFSKIQLVGQNIENKKILAS